MSVRYPLVPAEAPSPPSSPPSSVPLSTPARVPALANAPLVAPASAPANAIASAEFEVEFLIERVTRRFVAFRLSANNGRSSPMRCDVYAVDAASAGKISLLRLTVPPHERIDAGVVVRRRMAAGVIAEFRGRDLSALVRAPEPEAREGGRLWWAPVAGLATLALAGTFALGRGELVTNAAPATRPTARIGTGAGIAAAVPRPPTAALQVVAASTSARAAVPIPNAAESPQAARLIERLAVEAPSVGGGEPITVTYATTALEGEVRLIDDRGTVRAEALLSPFGDSLLSAPDVETEADFRVVLSVENGGRRDEREVPVRVVPAPGPTAPPTASERATAAKTGRPFLLGEKSVVAGSDLTLTIVRHEPEMRATMLDQDGNTVASELIDRAKTRVGLRVPIGTFPEAYTLDVSYVDEHGQEHAVVPIVVR